MITGFSILVGFLNVVLFPLSYSISTALIGSYSIARGIDLFAHGFINEYTLSMEIEEGRLAEVTSVTFIYLVGVLIVTIIGVFV